MKSIFVVGFTLALLSLSVYCLKDSDPKTPVWAPYFQQEFIQSYRSQGSFRTTATYWYDSQRNTTRIDRGNGIHDDVCGSVLPNESTPCIQLIRDSKRYVYYPAKKLCCVCCDADHGCGILKRDWLKTAKYEGIQELTNQMFDKWSIPDGDDTDYYWATQDEVQITRRIREGDQITKQFLMFTYRVNKAPDSVFALPPYCTEKLCPSSSQCGKFR